MRFAIAVVLLGAASAQDYNAIYGKFMGLGNAIYGKAMQLWNQGQTYLHQGEDGPEGHHKHHGGGHGKLHKMFEEAHACHRGCGEDAECHSKCPKPWATLAKACEDFPAIKSCRVSCDGADCDKCPTFDEEWMNKKIVKHPERVIKMIEKKCPMIKEANACHQGCKPGDHECHHKCPSMFHGHGHDGRWPHHGEHHGGKWNKFHEMMEKAHACHEKCGAAASCHSKCPSPWEPMVKACQDYPAIKACHSTCKDADCDKCPKFEVEMMNEMLAKHPERAEKMAEKKCPMIEKAHACHQACKPGDHECHHECPSMFHHGGHGQWPHHDEHGHWPHHGEHGDWHNMHEMMEKVHTCHKKCGADAACHDKCPEPPMVKACQDYPAIKACHATCKDTDCGKCPKFEMDQMNEIYAKHPERAEHMAEKMCPKIEKAHACHEACTPGDRECHHKCPSMRHHGGHGQWPRHDDHGEHGDWPHHGEHGHKQKFMKMMKEARACHEKCGKDVDCHSKCPKPWAPIVKACQDFPAIKACHTQCDINKWARNANSECDDKCPKFEAEWINKKYAKNPERATKMAEAKCPLVLKVHACHEACTPGDFECHHKCPHPMFHGHHGKHHDGEKNKEAEDAMEHDNEPILV